jgi:hypothetical protein
MNCLRGQRRYLGLVAAGSFFLLARPAQAKETIGALWERGLVLHEAWTEARLSMDASHLEAQWNELVGSLRRTLKKGVQMDISGDATHWRIELGLTDSPAAAVFVDPSGARVSTHGAPTATQAKTLLAFYPGRRHFDCDGQPLNPKAVGVPVQGRACALDRAALQTNPTDLTSDMGARVRPTEGVRGCYDVMSESGGVLVPTQMLVELPDRPYVMRRLNQENLWLRYLDNRKLFVMDRKLPRLYLVEPREPAPLPKR